MSRRRVPNPPLSEELVSDLNELLTLVEEATDRAAAARRHRRKVLGLGYLYVVLFESGVIKVGRTSNPEGRLRSHALTGLIRESWVSDEHFGCNVTEKALIGFCRSRGELYGGKEYFRGVSFGAASAHAELLVLKSLMEEGQALAAQRRNYLDRLHAASEGDDSMTWLDAHVRAFGADVPLPTWVPLHLAAAS